MKSEPEVFSIEDFAEQRTTWWEGVRNYQARNYMMNDMKIGDEVLFYHSNANPPGVVGLAKVIKKAQPDPSQFEKESPYFDPKATLDKPRWYCVQLEFIKSFKRQVSLEILRTNPDLTNLLVIKKGQRLSVQPVERLDFTKVCRLGDLENC